MEYIIVGTAGHIDHGKTVLVKTLTGIDTDRLEMEKNRGISIELGFAPFKLPSGRNVGIVDVPGHEKFIRNMLAGVGGIDLVILVVAADEGIMPQTREHLDIINLLGIKKGIVAVTKVDLVDAELLELVKEDLADNLIGTSLEGAQIVEVSALQGTGMEELISALDRLSADVEGKDAGGRGRLPVDRSFSMPGFGTIVTGTLWSGKFSTGDILRLEPAGLEVRVRGLQVHGKKVDRAFAGQRTAVNLASVQKEDVPRGSVLLEKNYLKPSYLVDAKLKLVNSQEKPLKNRARVKVYHGTSEKLGRVNILDKEKIHPGEESFVQLMLEKPLVAARGDRFVIRSYSPMLTIGGGQIIEPNAKKLRRFRAETIKLLQAKLQGSPEELVEQYLSSVKKACSTSEIAAAASILEEQALQACKKLKKEDRVLELIIENETRYISGTHFKEIDKSLFKKLSDYHKKYYLRPGVPKEELRSSLFSAWTSRQFNDLLSYFLAEGKIKIINGYVSLQDFEPAPSAEEEKIIVKLIEEYKKSGLKPPTWSEMTANLKVSQEKLSELKMYLLNFAEITKITPEILFHKKSVDDARCKLEEYLSVHGEITVAEARDLLQGTRKYILPLLEYFDTVGFTKRVGDKRIKSGK